MRKKYNVIEEPWIKVEFLDGHKEDKSIKEILKEAHTIKDIVHNHSVTVADYCVYRLLLMMIADAYNIGTNLRARQRSKVDLYEDGKFDETVIENYLKECYTEGVTFDLFDDERPFAGIGKTERETKETCEFKLSTIADISMDKPSPTSVIFYNKLNSAEETRVEIGEYIKYILLNNLVNGFKNGNSCCWQFQGGNTYALFNLIKGKNLFETLVFSAPNKTDADDKPFYRWKEYYLGRFTKVDNYGVLTTMFIPSRTIYHDEESYDEESKTISKVYLANFQAHKPEEKDSEELTPTKNIRASHYQTLSQSAFTNEMYVAKNTNYDLKQYMTILEYKKSNLKGMISILNNVNKDGTTNYSNLVTEYVGARIVQDFEEFTYYLSTHNSYTLESYWLEFSTKGSKYEGSGKTIHIIPSRLKEDIDMVMLVEYVDKVTQVLVNALKNTLKKIHTSSETTQIVQTIQTITEDKINIAFDDFIREFLLDKDKVDLINNFKKRIKREIEDSIRKVMYRDGIIEIEKTVISFNNEYRKVLEEG